MVLFEDVKGEFETVFQGIQAVEGKIMKEFLAQFVPKVFDRIQFGCVGRQRQSVDVGGNDQCVAGMPTRTVEHHHDMIDRMTHRDLIEKHLHTITVDVRQNQGVPFAAVDIPCGVSVGVLVGEHACTADEWAWAPKRDGHGPRPATR